MKDAKLRVKLREDREILAVVHKEFEEAITMPPLDRGELERKLTHMIRACSRMLDQIAWEVD